MSFEEFDTSEIEKQKRQYEKEVRERWGDTQAFNQSVEKTAKYSQDDWKRVRLQADGILDEFVLLMESEATKEQMDAAAKKWQGFITESYYDCTDEIMIGLAQMYAGDPRFKKNLDKKKEGLAEFMSRAIQQCFQ